MSTTSRGAQPHPGHGLVVVLLTAGLVLLIRGYSHGHARLVPLVVGSLAVVGALLLHWLGRAVQIVNAAVECAARNEAGEAARLLDEAERRYGRLVARNVGLQRARLAWAAGDLDATCQHATEAVEGGSRSQRLGVFTLDTGSVVPMAQGLRALARAAMGQSEAARSDIQGVRDRRSGRAEPLAHAELAQGLLLSSGGDSARLGRHLAACCWLLFEHLPPRERFVAHALWRSAYRDRRRGGADRAVPSIGADRLSADGAAIDAPSATSDMAWAARLVPRLQEFMIPWDASSGGTRALDPVRDPPASTEAKAGGRPADREADRQEPGARTRAEGRSDTTPAAEKTAARRGRAVWRLLAAAVALAVVLMASWKLARRTPTEADSGAAADPSTTIRSASRGDEADGAPGVAGTALSQASSQTSVPYPYLLGSLGVSAIVVWLVSSVRRQARLSSARLLLAQGDLDAAQQQLARLQTTGNSLVRAVALFEMARIADRRGEFESTRGLCHEALRLLKRARVPASDRVRADLMALDGLASVLLGADEPADQGAKNVRLRARWSQQANDVLARARLLVHLRRGDWGAAQGEAASLGVASPVDPRSRILVDAVQAILAADGAAASELRSLLRDWEIGARWLEKAAPVLVSRLADRRAHGGRA